MFSRWGLAFAGCGVDRRESGTLRVVWAVAISFLERNQWESLETDSMLTAVRRQLLHLKVGAREYRSHGCHPAAAHAAVIDAFARTAEFTTGLLRRGGVVGLACES